MEETQERRSLLGSILRRVHGMRPSSPVSFRQRSLNFRFFLLIASFSLFFVFYKFYFTPEGFPDPDETLVIVITPTHKRLERLADMTRMSQTLQHVKNLHWVVVEDGTETVPAVERILIRSGLPYVYLCTTTAPGMPARGWTHRNLALQYIRENYNDVEAVVYFGDDDNSYDIRLFDNYIRHVRRIGVWAVGLVGGAYVEAPRVEEGKVKAWNVVFAPSRTFATDMAGFGINLREIKRAGASFNEKCAKTYKQGPESCFLSQFGWRRDQLEPFGYNDDPREVLVWHTKTSKTKARGPHHGYVIEEEKEKPKATKP